jgi:NAD(P)-dependent dehydrogenase (short-subunit alcohol dehydrogenase family)
VTWLREELLRERVVVLAGGVPEVIRDALSALGAGTEEIAIDVDRARTEERTAEGPPFHSPLDVLVYDARPAFGDGGDKGLQAALECGWAAIRAVVTGGLIESKRPGTVMLLAPRPDAGPFAEAARSALENLARTLSVEWARYGIKVTAIAPGPATNDRELAALVCFLASPAGDYFSGCRFSLGTVGGAGGGTI